MELESSVEKDKIDLGLTRLRLHRRCTKRAIPIRAKMATTPPMVPPAIAAMFRFLRDGGRTLVVGTNIHYTNVSGVQIQFSNSLT